MVIVTTRSAFVRDCLYCGPRQVSSQPDRERNRRPDWIMCPSCHLDPIEVRAIEKVREHGFEFCYREEVRKVSGRGA